MDLPTEDGFPYKDDERTIDQTLAGAIAKLNELPEEYKWENLTKLQKYWYYIAQKGFGAMEKVTSLPIDEAKINLDIFYHLVQDDSEYSKGIYYYDINAHSWVKMTDKNYVDMQDAATLSAAKSYTDSAVGNIETVLHELNTGGGVQ